MKIAKFEFNLFGVNTYIIYDESSREAAIIDPGMMKQSENEAIDNFVSKNKLKVKYLINTHIHIDHIAGDKYISEKYGVPVSASVEDAFLSSTIKAQAQMFHLPFDIVNILIENGLTDGDTLYLGDEKMEIILVPGHSPGSIAIYLPESGVVIVGDALFKMSIGRTDLPGGNHATLINSIKTKLLSLPSETIVLSGHGNYTTIDDEKRYNPFLK